MLLEWKAEMTKMAEKNIHFFLIHAKMAPKMKIAMLQPYPDLLMSKEDHTENQATREIEIMASLFR